MHGLYRPARETVFCRPLTFPTKTPGSEKEAETDPHDVFPGRPAAKIMNHRDRSVAHRNCTESDSVSGDLTDSTQRTEWRECQRPVPRRKYGFMTTAGRWFVSIRPGKILDEFRDSLRSQSQYMSIDLSSLKQPPATDKLRIVTELWRRVDG